MNGIEIFLPYFLLLAKDFLFLVSFLSIHFFFYLELSFIFPSIPSILSFSHIYLPPSLSLFITPSFCSIFSFAPPRPLTQQLELAFSIKGPLQPVHEHLNRPTRRERERKKEKSKQREASKRRVASRCFTECIFHRIDATLSRQSSRGILHKISLGIEQASGFTS